MSKHDGGPAFPVSYDHDTFQPNHVSEAKQLMSGMSLRDYFAASALVGLCAHPLGPKENPGENAQQAHARAAYDYADAMLEARTK